MPATSLTSAVERLGISPTSRIKNTGTILEKLSRNGGSGLKSMQDLAGMRIVGEFDHRGQDELAERIVAMFAGDGRAPKVVDRRAVPMHGYRAVHVIVFPEGAPIEVQVRTKWQHEWAEFFEKLADLVGRGIRYGESPAKGWNPESAGNPVAAEYFVSRYQLHQAVVEWALRTAALIDAVETGEKMKPDDPEIRRYREDIDEDLSELRRMLSRISEAEDLARHLPG